METLFFERFCDYASDNKLNWNYHFLFLILHLRKHMINYGVGFRQFYDIAVVANGNGSEMDWGWIGVKLQELGLFDYTKNCCAFCEKWFQVQMPLSSPSVEEKFYQETTEKIFADGVFGFEDHTNKENFAVNAIRFSDNSHGISMLVAALRKIFPSYETLTANKSLHFCAENRFFFQLHGFIGF